MPELVAPHLTKNETGSARGQAELDQLLTVLKTLGPDPQLRVARLELVHPDVTEATLESGAKVRLGSVDQLPGKIKLLSAVLDRLGSEQVEYMDLSNPSAAYWRPKSKKTAAVKEQ